MDSWRFAVGFLALVGCCLGCWGSGLKGGDGGTAGAVVAADAGGAGGSAAGNAADAGPGVGGTAATGGVGGAAGGSTSSVATGGRGSAGGAAGGSTHTVASGGAGSGGAPAGASLDLDGSRMDFGAIALGTTKVATFTLTNRGTSTSGRPVVTTQPGGGVASTVTVTGCDAALAANASCVLTIAVTPGALGLVQRWVRISAEPGTDPYLSIYVVGNAIGFEMSPPSSVDFGVLATGALRQHVVTITALIALSDLEVRRGGEEVSINPSSTTCASTLAAGSSCVVTVDFLATTVGWKEGALSIRAGGDMGQFARVVFTANVSNGSGLDIEPKKPPTYACVFEETSPPVVFTVTNVGTTTSGTISSKLQGEFASDYAISDSNCSVLAPQATCTISVVCRPPMSASAAAREAILSVNDGNTHLSVPLNGKVSF